MQGPAHSTEVSILEDCFFINGQPTYPGRFWEGHKIEGLLMNARLVQGIFDDLNPDTVPKWQYPDTHTWDPDRNTHEFIQAMDAWRLHGMLALTINLQGGSPEGYSRHQPWENSAIRADGTLRPEYMQRLTRICDRADELGMIVILGIFYFGQAHRLQDESAIHRAVDSTVEWVFEHDYRNILIEVDNECDVQYQQPLLRPEGVPTLIRQVKAHSSGGRRLLASVSLGGRAIPPANILSAVDFVLLHGNGADDPQTITQMVLTTRQAEGYHRQPVLFNEDDHFDFEQPLNNMTSAICQYAGWGFFDYRMPGEGFDEGYQSVPVNWSISSARKRGFFNKLSEITGGGQTGSTKPVSL